ncbi:hypothetical protein MP228_008593 [Amoeboaphelidium protococcarum]|nr:hypothetical protein MP228_012052 [Amoeboaphelidium protococcarum]KAI3645665.1 hypothetical protein MP228_008593 [Amoeboaphelidium protococcarum]
MSLKTHGQNWNKIAHLLQNRSPQECKLRYKQMLAVWRRESPNDKERRLHGSKRLVMIAMGSNAVVCVSKLSAAIYTGSSALMAESLHSAMDMINQCLLYVGIKRSIRQPSPTHPYGFHKELYGWAIISAVGVLFVGGGVPIYTGISALIDGIPQAMTASQVQVGFSVLGCALVSESFTAYKAYKQVAHNAQKSQMSVKEYLRNGSDSSSVQVLLEDSSSVIGSIIAGSCLGLSQLYRDFWWLDPIGSCGIGALLSSVALFLIRRNLSMMLESSMPSNKVAILQKIITTDPIVQSIQDVKTAALSPEDARFKAEVQFNSVEVTRRYIMNNEIDLNSELQKVKSFDKAEQLESYLTQFGGNVIEHLGDEIDRIEENIKDNVPEVKHVDIEVM